MSEEGTPVKLIINEPEGQTQVLEFAQDTIKIGRGRSGKTRKGVDVQLSDESVARVAAVLHVRGPDDVYIMDMGSGGTRIDGKNVGARGKISSGTKVLIGNTEITVFIGDDASQAHSAEFDNALLDESPEDKSLEIQSNVSFDSLDGSLLPEEDLVTAARAADTGAHEASDVHISSTHWDQAGEATPPEGTASPAVARQATAPQRAPASMGTGGFAGQVSIPSQGRFGLPPASQENPGVPEGFGLYPVHQTPVGYFGPVGPPPPALPAQMTGPDLSLLLNVADRLGKELWYLQMPPW